MPKYNNTDIYSYDAVLDPRDYLLGTDWNNAKKSKNYKLEHLRYFILQGLDPTNNGFITTTGYTLVDNILTINAGWVWQLNGMLFTNEEEVEFPLEYTAEGFVRIDSIYANANNTFGIISGQESETIAVPPAIPVNTLLALSVNVFDTTIVGGEGPVLGASYVKKSFYSTSEYNGVGSNVIIPFNPNGYSEIRLINSGLVSISGFDLSLMTGPNAEFPYQGKEIMVWNRTGGNVTLKHEDFATADYPMFLRAETDLVLPDNHILTFKYDAGGLQEKDKSFFSVDEIIGLASVLASKANLVAGKIPASELPSYVDDVLEFANLAAFPATGETGKIYLALDTNFTYRWSGSVYAKISDTGKLDKVTTVDVEKVYVKNADGTQSTKPTSDFGTIKGTGTINRISKFTASDTIGDSQIFDNGTNVGIGTTTPQARLDVKAQGVLATDIVLRVRNSTDTQNFLVVNGAGDVYNNGAKGVNTNTFFGENVGRNATGSNNTAFGVGALYANTTGYYNTAIGVSALYANTTGNSNTAFGVGALYANTTGYSNTAIGVSALQNNTTGYSNMAIGQSALRANTTGNSNTAIGVSALQNNTTGYSNMAIGLNALGNNTTGLNNTAIGNSAARYTSDGITDNTTSNNSIFLGSNTAPLANNQTNQIVIGDSAIGLGSNSVVLGNSSITRTRLQGQVIIGTFATPPTGIEGAIYYDSAKKKHYGFDGITWNPLY